MERLAKFQALPLSDRLLLAQVMFALALARLAVALLPFRLIGMWASRRPTVVASQQARSVAIERVRWAVAVCARRAPFRAKCFEQGLATQGLLRHRGVAATLHFGAARDWENLIAHVWITADDEAVIGCAIKHRFFEFVRFPRPAKQGAMP